MKEGLVRRGVRKLLAHFPAVVTDVSWPSLAWRVGGVSLGDWGFEGGREGYSCWGL